MQKDFTKIILIVVFLTLAVFLILFFYNMYRPNVDGDFIGCNEAMSDISLVLGNNTCINSSMGMGNISLQIKNWHGGRLSEEGYGNLIAVEVTVSVNGNFSSYLSDSYSYRINRTNNGANSVAGTLPLDNSTEILFVWGPNLENATQVRLDPITKIKKKETTCEVTQVVDLKLCK